MNRYRVIGVAAAALTLSACAGLTDFINALPTPTPQEQCEDGGGHWRTVTRYDASGNETQTGECISK